MKKIIITVIVLAAFCSTTFGQTMPLYTQYNLNPFTINPAAAGVNEGQQINLTHRSQWLNFPTSPKTNVLTYQGRFNNSGLGLLLYNDNTGALEYKGILAAYNYRIKLSDDYTVAMGLSTQLLRYNVDLSDALLAEDLDMSDEVLQDALGGVNRLDASFGAMFYATNGLYAGVSVPNLIQTKLTGTTSFDDFSYLSTHFFFLAGYKTQGKFVNIEPSVLVRKVVNAPFQVELNAKAWFMQDQLMAGVSYRTAEESLALTFGCDINKTFGFFYSYDLSFNEMSNYHNGSNEFMIQYRFGGKKEEKIKK